MFSSMSLQVGHVQRVSIVPNKIHEMRTLSLKPLLFGRYIVQVNKWDFTQKNLIILKAIQI